jgi:hypothetical protein
MVPDLSQVNRFHDLTANLSNSHFNIFFSSAPWFSKRSLPFMFSDQDFVHIFHRNLCANGPLQIWKIRVVYWYRWTKAFLTLPIFKTVRVFASVRESKVRERLAVCKRTKQTFNMGRLNLSKPSQTEGKEEYRFKIVMNLRVPQNVGKFLRRWATGGFSRRVQLHGVS